MHVIRPAGYNERRCIHRESLGVYGSVIVTGTYTLDEQQVLPASSLKDKVIKALKSCIDQHAALRLVILDEDNERPQLGIPQSLDLDAHLRMIDAPTNSESYAESLESLLSSAQNEPYHNRSEVPAWRLYVQPLPGNESPKMRVRCVFAYSHALLDGGSGLIFHTTFLSALRNLSGSAYDSSTQHILSETSAIPPALDQAAKFPISWSFLLTPLLAHLLPKPIATIAGVSSTIENGVNGVWLGSLSRPNKASSQALVHTSLKVLQIPHDLIQNALVKCRAHKVRLTGVLHQLLIRALHEHLPTVSGQRYTKFVGATPLDLRHSLSKKDPSLQNFMANYPSGITETLEISANADFSGSLTAAEWQSAQATSEALKSAANTLNDQSVALLSYVSNIRDWVLEKSKTPATTSYEISNLGRFDGGGFEPGQEKWNVCDMAFSQSADASGPSFGLNIVSCNNAPMAAIFSWLPGALGVEDEDDFIQAVSKSLIGGLANLV